MIIISSLQMKKLQNRLCTSATNKLVKIQARDFRAVWLLGLSKNKKTEAMFLQFWGTGVFKLICPPPKAGRVGWPPPERRTQSSCKSSVGKDPFVSLRELLFFRLHNEHCTWFFLQKTQSRGNSGIPSSIHDQAYFIWKFSWVGNWGWSFAGHDFLSLFPS